MAVKFIRPFPKIYFYFIINTLPLRSGLSLKSGVQLIMMSKEMLYAAERIAECVKHDVNSISEMNGYFGHIKRRAHQPALVEIIQPADKNLKDDDVLVVIKGDIWCNGPFFKRLPEGAE
jgi:hypothetical protein